MAENEEHEMTRWDAYEMRRWRRMKVRKDMETQRKRKETHGSFKKENTLQSLTSGQQHFLIFLCVVFVIAPSFFLGCRYMSEQVNAAAAASAFRVLVSSSLSFHSFSKPAGVPHPVSC